MSDVIKLLPDHIANQIAAGEVIQRPASVVKELIENAIDAGATQVGLVVKDAGKTLIQVIDNGSGMSENDTYLAFERHATSKVSTAEDLFALKTKGFRGEALASIAAIAHVELKTKQAHNELGTVVQIEGSERKSVEPALVPNGSSFSVKNLFFNVPARRNFLKSDAVESKHIIEEFIRIALTHPEVGFTMHHNGQELYKLAPTDVLRKRIVDLFGKAFNDKLVPVDEHTDIVSISGFVVKPEFAKKTAGEQYFFVNNRFFRDRYFQHAIKSAFDNLIPKDHQAGYFLYFTVDPSSIDVNVHPTKTEIKFEEDKHIYAILRSSVKQALGKYNIAPTLDFDQEVAFPTTKLGKDEAIRIPTIQVNPNYNPFDTSPKDLSGKTYSADFPKVKTIKPNKSDWEQFYTIETEENQPAQARMDDFGLSESADHEETPVGQVIQLQKRYLLTPVKSGVWLIDQHRAHTRILYDELMSQFLSHPIASQQLLFPIERNFSHAEKGIWEAHAGQIKRLGFVWEWNEECLQVVGVPDSLPEEQLESSIEDLLVALSINDLDPGEIAHTLILSLAKSSAIPSGQSLQSEEMNHIISSLFTSKEPSYTPDGKRIISQISLSDLTKEF
jgi:DNA mismatch repair protein MutL